MEPLIGLETAWPALLKATFIGIDKSFQERFIPDAVEKIVKRMIECAEKGSILWEIIFVGTGGYLLPEMVLLYTIIKERFRVQRIHFIDSMYHQHSVVNKEKVESAIAQSFGLMNSQSELSINVSNVFPVDDLWESNGRIVLAFSRLTHWASSYSNIAKFLVRNWNHVYRNCGDRHIAFLDIFMHIDEKTEQLIVSDFSDLTQPSRERDRTVRYFGTTWEDLWTDYVKSMIHPELRNQVRRMQSDENYETYCAKYSVITPNDARDAALDLCKLCGR